jgi:hypothetical protein
VFRCKRWVINSRTEGLSKKSVSELNQHYLLCAEHFEPSQFMNSEQRRSLVHNALPTLFSVPNPPKVLQNKRPAPTERSHVPTKKRRLPLTTGIPRSKASDINLIRFSNSNIAKAGHSDV